MDNEKKTKHTHTLFVVSLQKIDPVEDKLTENRTPCSEQGGQKGQKQSPVHLNKEVSSGMQPINLMYADHITFQKRVPRLQIQ